MSVSPVSTPAIPTVTNLDQQRLTPPLPIVGDEIWVIASSRSTGGAFAVMQSRSGPNVGPPLHCHTHQDEWWYILEGEYLFEIDGKQTRATVGDMVFAPRGSCHTFLNIGNTPARSIVTVVPGGLDIFFEELSAVAPYGTPPDPSTLVPIFQRHNLELLGPPLSAR